MAELKQLEYNSTGGAYTNRGSAGGEPFIQRKKVPGGFVYTYPPTTLGWLLETLGQRYEFEDPLAVNRFLRENPWLIGLLLGARQKIRDYFDPDTRATLRVVVDPEAREDERLFVYIQTGLPPKEALAHLSDLDDGWWLEALSGARHQMTIDVEYV